AWAAGGLIACAALFASGGARADTLRYKLDAGASHVAIHVGKSGLLGFVGHEHEVVAPALRGAVSADPDHLAQASVDVTFDVAALRVTGSAEPAKDGPQVTKTILGPEGLAAAPLPTSRFVSTAVGATGGPTGERQVTIHGRLTLHGVTRAVVVNARVDFKGDTIEASGTTTIRQTDFG